jgi:hypothetical protein
MDKITQYRALIRTHLTTVAELINRRPTPGVETFCAFDDEHGHYLLMRFGWTKDRRVRAITLFLRLREGKIWIEEDWTEDGIALDLLRAGVPKEDIVLAFQAPEVRATPQEIAVA